MAGEETKDTTGMSSRQSSEGPDSSFVMIKDTVKGKFSKVVFISWQCDVTESSVSSEFYRFKNLRFGLCLSCFDRTRVESRKVRQNAFYSDKTRQNANFRGNPLLQSNEHYKKQTYNLAAASWVPPV